MPTSLIPVLIGIFVVILVGLVVMIMRGRGAADNLEERLNELAALGEPITLEQLELSQPFYDRAIVPILEWLNTIVQRFSPQNSVEALEHKLALAGLSNEVKPSQFTGKRMAYGIVLGVAGLALGIVSAVETGELLLYILGGFFGGFFLPYLQLRSQIQSRQDEITKALPDALDLLTICVEAGLGFDAAMSKVAEKWDNELSRAFMKTVQEMQLGKLRREALRSMANGMDVPDMTSFTAAIIQADQLGVSMAKVMRIQSDTMRLKRRQRAEEKAQQAPIKMMFPMIFLIFPTILIVLLGPAAIQIRDAGVFGF